ncbi:ABC transporter ATP-binding protein [Acinetobacter shaoyimingii]|uniref:ABC transporter ATP-binding protein n=1 Tax=Acinetobacter shaoyimingii TaxID=2715164 RepID=A0A6G8RZ81_9GAMM|nr:ABC transporter ATP-binding protein [Acinetobacter shaoyimingii]NHB59056.1 ABC transporter ATP-binding protein [Acinetobacter shaoyimingii]QIO07249.1 ABC transporter ATP-binding protein [Acinetobacter shaoyimingii]
MASQHQAGAVSIQKLSKTYTNNNEDLTVLEDINLDIQAGEFISIVGSSGCGKSTLLRLLVGLENQYQGEILTAGQKIKGTSLNRGIIFQDHRLFPWLSVKENIRVALHQSNLSRTEEDKIIDEHLELVKLTNFKDAYPSQLSGGMNQRVAIARSLVNRPQILLLDEPFGALDALTRQNLQDELQRIWQTEKITMIIVTHDVEEAVFLGDRVVVMQPHPGRIKRIVNVPVPHPRKRDDVRLTNIKNNILVDFTDPIKDELLKSKAPASFSDYQFAW